ncbi:ubiquitin carboxyl-terminal hydrolase 8-like isoform X3 [Canna indica]|uniref:Ubiquitin carboxyl-terminal hydrolase 8-like isoform X3 n=1 Tax=Canna indica TaxID=4628 RepID=A0AAQ3KAJ0_9LILI|nr:ubiquitin carboxyl-terminal hydrolase 8-like isoform X3 [Canna indica]
MRSMAIRWHYEASSKMENCGTSYLSEDASDDVYPLMLRISAVQETSVVTVKICTEKTSRLKAQILAEEHLNNWEESFVFDALVEFFDVAGVVKDLLLIDFSWSVIRDTVTTINPFFFS